MSLALSRLYQLVQQSKIFRPRLQETLLYPVRQFDDRGIDRYRKAKPPGFIDDLTIEVVDLAAAALHPILQHSRQRTLDGETLDQSVEQHFDEAVRLTNILWLHAENRNARVTHGLTHIECFLPRPKHDFAHGRR